MARRLVLTPLPDVDEMPGDRGGGGHRRRHEVRAALEALAALEVAVRGRSAALLRLQLVRVHGKTHRAAGLTPLEAGLEEDFVEAFGFRLLLHRARARHDHRTNIGADRL